MLHIAPRKLSARRAIPLAIALALATQPAFAIDPPTDRAQVDKTDTAPVAPSDAVEVQDLASAQDYFDANGAGDGSDAAAADGANATAAGASSVASGENSAAFGFGSAALGDDSTAIGPFSLAIGTGSSAFGFGTTALGDYSTALGYGSNASGFASMALGYNASSNGAGAIAIGTEATLSLGPIGEGDATFVTRADGLLSTALGPGAQADGDRVGGHRSRCAGDGRAGGGHRPSRAGHGPVPSAVGNFAIAGDYLATAMGSQAEATRLFLHVHRRCQQCRGHGIRRPLGAQSYAHGKQSTAIGMFAHAWDDLSIAFGNAAYSDGYGSTAIGYQAHTWGEGSIAIGTLAVTGGDRPPESLPPPCDPATDPDCGVVGPLADRAAERTRSRSARARRPSASAASRWVTTA